MKHMAVVLVTLSLLIGGVAPLPSEVGAADWISGADSYAATWVKDIEQEITKKDHRAVFLNDPRAPQVSVLRLLNQAAIAHESKNDALATELVREALDVLETGVRKNYFTQTDIDPIVSYIKRHVPVKIG